MKSKSQLKLIYFLTCLTLMPVFVLSGYYIYTSRNNAVKEKIKKIHALALARQATLENHLSNYIKSMEAIAGNTTVQEFLLNHETGPSEAAYDIVKQFQEVMWGASHHIFISDPKGNIILSPYHGENKKSTHLHHSIAESKYFTPSLESVQVTDFYGFEESTHYHQLVMVPIKKNGQTLGVIISEITIQYFIDLLRKDFELGKTGEIYLSTLDFKKVVHLKKDKISDTKSSLLVKADQKGMAYGENLSHDKHNVLSSYIKSKKFPWILAVEIDKKEVIAPINKLTWYVSAAYLFFICVFLLVFRQIIKMLKKPVQDVSKIIQSISQEAVNNSNEMKNNTSGLVDGSLKLAEALVENQGQLEKVVDDIKVDADIIKNSLEKSLSAKESADMGEDLVSEMTHNINNTYQENEKMHNEFERVMKDILKIIESIKLIQEKTQLINDIVFQTKLLSFNASVEAARAGEHGKGFAVVAEEVGNLAAMSGNTSDEIHKMIEESVSEVESIVERNNKNLKHALERSTKNVELTKSSIERCKDLFLKIIQSINNVHQDVTNISQKANEKVVVIKEVNDRFVHLKEVSEQSSHVATAVGNISQKLQKDSFDLAKVSNDLAEKFSA